VLVIDLTPFRSCHRHQLSRAVVATRHLLGFSEQRDQPGAVGRRTDAGLAAVPQL
jgi:hypothetical protein